MGSDLEEKGQSQLPGGDAGRAPPGGGPHSHAPELGVGLSLRAPAGGSCIRRMFLGCCCPLPGGGCWLALLLLITGEWLQGPGRSSRGAGLAYVTIRPPGDPEQLESVLGSGDAQCMETEASGTLPLQSQCAGGVCSPVLWSHPPPHGMEVSGPPPAGTFRCSLLVLLAPGSRGPSSRPALMGPPQRRDVGAKVVGGARAQLDHRTSWSVQTRPLADPHWGLLL